MFFERGAKIEGKCYSFTESDCGDVSRTGFRESGERGVPSVREQRKVYECEFGGEYRVYERVRGGNVWHRSKSILRVSVCVH